MNAGFFYKSAEDREKLVKAERKHTNSKVQQIIDLKKSICEGTNSGFVVINQKVCPFEISVKLVFIGKYLLDIINIMGLRLSAMCTTPYVLFPRRKLSL